MCLQYRHLTDTVCASSLLSTEEENLQPHLLWGPSFQQLNKWSQKEISICNKLLCMAKCNLSFCAVFKWSLMFVGKRNCVRRKKKKTWVKGTAHADERTLKNVLCLSQCKTPLFGIRRNGKAGVLWYLTVLRPFLKLFSLRGGGHYLPRGFRLPSFSFCHFKV